LNRELDVAIHDWERKDPPPGDAVPQKLDQDLVLYNGCSIGGVDGRASTDDPGQSMARKLYGGDALS
jgi:hypothetical protein